MLITTITITIVVVIVVVFIIIIILLLMDIISHKYRIPHIDADNKH